MTRSTGIRKYLDAGSLDLFARQLTESLDNAVSVAVFDADGSLAWCGPGHRDQSLWPSGGFVQNPFAAEAGRVELRNGRFAYAFPLQQAVDDEPLAHVLVQAQGRKRLSAEQARRDAGPVLDCLYKQLDIQLELSSVRRQTERERRDFALLIRLDDLRDLDDRQGKLGAALTLAAEHFDAALAVLWMKDASDRLAWRRHDGAVIDDCAGLEPILSRIFDEAHRRRRILEVAAPSALAAFAGAGSRRLKLLVSPMLDGDDRVAGMFAFATDKKYSSHDARFIRVVASRMAKLLARPAPPQTDFSRYDLLAAIDRELAADPDRPGALLVIDVDKLHVVNEMHGYHGGDAAVNAVFDRACLAAGERATVCNLQGGAVAVFLPGCDAAQAGELAEGIREGLAREAPVHDGRRIDVEISTGIALLPSSGQDATAALSTAEVAARSAKSRGGNRCVVFDNLDASVLRRREDLDQVGQLQAALLDNRFELFAQRIAALSDDDCRPRFEILLRMVDESGELCLPNRFLPAAERYQMMTSIDRWVVRTVTEMLSSIENQLEINLASFSINVSTQSMMDEEFPNFVEDCIHNCGVAADSFCFEITETSVMRDLERARALLCRFRDLGCRLALDDFGTGQCSFAYLKDLPVNYVKIDGRFVRDILDNPLSEAIVESVARISEVIHARTIAEYVENGHILERLRRAGIDFAQGYLIGRPIPFREVLRDFDAPLVNAGSLLSVGD